MGGELETRVRDRLRERLAQEPEVEVAALFGSAARGRLGPGSDVDIYVRLRGGVQWPVRRQIDLALRLSEVVGREVDLVVEDDERTSVILRREVARTGQILHEAWPGAWTRLRARAMLAYADLEPLMRRCADGVREALRRRREQLGG